jgi:phenylacetic acid degradation operon negative regulatory protein
MVATIEFMLHTDLHVQQVRNIEAQPFTARSVIASLLLGMRRPELSGQRLVRAGALFGLSEGAVRVALSRMVAAGELATDGGSYRLAGPLLERHGRQEEGRRPRLRRWDGTWLLGVVGAGGERRAPAERAAIRRRLSALRLAEWREGVWLRPDNLGPVAAVEGCRWWTGGRPDGPVDAGALWDLEGWSRRAVALERAMSTTPVDRIAASFGVAAAVVRHLRDDPLLPPALLPADWPADRLRAAYDGYEAAFQATLAPVVRR